VVITRLLRYYVSARKCASIRGQEIGARSDWESLPNDSSNNRSAKLAGTVTLGGEKASRDAGHRYSEGYMRTHCTTLYGSQSAVTGTEVQSMPLDVPLGGQGLHLLNVYLSTSRTLVVVAETLYFLAPVNNAGEAQTEVILAGEVDLDASAGGGSG
jgi:hypothetical protein